jgi:hypothetical protein
VGCNLLDPGGTGSLPKDNADAWVDLGQRALQDRNFTGAWTDFSTALALDSSKSLAYQGLAKAELGRDGFPISRLVHLGDSVSQAPDSGKVDILLGMGDSTLNLIYRPLMRVAQIYTTLQRMESTGRSDRVFGFHLVQNELSAILAGRIYFQVVDANRDTLIQPSELSMARLLRMGGNQGLGLDASRLAELVKPDSSGSVPDSVVQLVNQVFGNVSNLVTDTASRNLIAAGLVGSDTSSAATKLSQQGLDFLGALGGSSTFYQVNDSLDDDGDGCIDEEIFGDNLDNDGDSLVDEDARIGSLATTAPTAGGMAFVAPKASFLHDRMALSNGKLVLVPGDDNLLASTWADASGRLALFQGLRWVRWDDASDTVRNDTIWTRVVNAYGYTPTTVKSAPDYEKIRSVGISEVRKKVLAMPADASRVLLGRRIVGGCWDNVEIP